MVHKHCLCCIMNIQIENHALDNAKKRQAMNVFIRRNYYLEEEYIVANFCNEDNNVTFERIIVGCTTQFGLKFIPFLIAYQRKLS